MAGMELLSPNHRPSNAECTAHTLPRSAADAGAAPAARDGGDGGLRVGRRGARRSALPPHAAAAGVRRQARWNVVHGGINLTLWLYTGRGCCRQTSSAHRPECNCSPQPHAFLCLQCLKSSVSLWMPPGCGGGGAAVAAGGALAARGAHHPAAEVRPGCPGCRAVCSVMVWPAAVLFFLRSIPAHVGHAGCEPHPPAILSGSYHSPLPSPLLPGQQAAAAGPGGGDPGRPWGGSGGGAGHRQRGRPSGCGTAACTARRPRRRRTWRPARGCSRRACKAVRWCRTLPACLC